MDIIKGEKFIIEGNEYEVIEVELLGNGGFGKIFKARISTNSRPDFICAIKCLNLPKIDIQSREKAKELFEREAKILQKLNGHNHIPKFIFYSREKLFLGQELISGHTLSQELMAGTWREQETIQMLKELLNIIRFVHRKCIIHRDIKPENIMRRTRDKKLVLIDFGAVKETFSTQIMSGTKIQTRGYAPEEQIQGNPEFSSDIYSLSITAIVMLTGLQPDELKDSNGNFTWHEKVNISNKLLNILNKMSNEDYKQRYKMPAEVLWDLEKSEETILQVLTSSKTKNIVRVRADDDLPSIPFSHLMIIITILISVVLLIFQSTGLMRNNKDVKQHAYYRESTVRLILSQSN
jgi:eukaryotic-like serine/threonine-protein kinase